MLMASDIWSVWILLEPCRGRSDTIVYWPEPCGAWRVEMLTGVPAFAPPPPLELLPLLPQPAATASARTATIGMARNRTGPITVLHRRELVSRAGLAPVRRLATVVFTIPKHVVQA